MADNRDLVDLSELEREFELEMEGDLVSEPESEFEEGLPAEYGDNLESETGDDSETDDTTRTYAERFYELSQRGYESEYEMEGDVSQLVNEMEQEFFFGGLAKRLRKAGRGLLKKGLRYAAGKIPALQALQGLTQLTRGNLKGMLGSLAKAGLASAIPGGAVALPALKALGFEASEDPEANREAWQNYAEVSREAFEQLSDTLHENADQPMEASRLASTAFQTALKNVQSRLGATGRGTMIGYGRPVAGQRIPVIRLRRGERVIIRAV
jgi:hypothetical protein